MDGEIVGRRGGWVNRGIDGWMIGGCGWSDRQMNGLIVMNSWIDRWILE